MKQPLMRTASVCALVVAMGGGAALAQTREPGAETPQSGPSAPQMQQKDTQQKAPEGGRSETGRTGGDAAQQKGAQPGQRTGQEQRGQDKDRQRTGQEQRGQDKDRQRTGQERRGDDKDRARTGQDQRQRGDRARQGQAERDRGEATQLSEQQRTNVRERFTRRGVERNRVTDVNFDIRVGSKVPRSVVLHTLPPDVVEVVPAYRGYRYVYVRDEIVIVNPATYAVVAVITSDGNRAAGVRDRRPSLAAAERSFVREHVDRSAAIRLGIGDIRIGMAVPQSVELLPLPGVVVERIPALRDYRYFVYEDDIVVVAPDNDEVVLVVER